MNPLIEDHTMSIPLFSAPTGESVFEHWLMSASSREALPLSEESAAPYRYIWQSWCEWLTNDRGRIDPMHYLHATPQDVTLFLERGPTASASRRKGNSAPISPVTRHRYAWLLSEVYQYAFILGYITDSPVNRLILGRAPRLEESGGQALPHQVLHALMRNLEASRPTKRAVFQLRDKAILLTLLCTGLKSDELCALRLSDLTRNKPVPGQFLMHIEGERKAQERQVSTRGLSGDVLFNWLRERETLLEHRHRPWVFLSKRGDKLSEPGLYRVVSSWIERACQDAGFSVPNHIGPGTLRNSLILEAIRTGPPIWTDSRICQYFGLQSTRSVLRNLGHHLEAGPQQPISTRCGS